MEYRNLLPVILFLTTFNFSAVLYPQTYIKSDFEIDDEGWTVVDNGSSTIPDYHSTGGNPGGYISDKDIFNLAWGYFLAPAKFLGNKANFYGDTLRFDMRQSQSGYVQHEDIILTGDSITIYYNFQYSPGFNWTPYVIPLNDTSGWKNLSTGQPANQAEIITVLSELESFKIRGDFITGLTLDTVAIDNVTIGDVGGVNTTFQLSVSVTDGWNMVSVPGLHPISQDPFTWWPSRDPAANVFRYNNGYQAIDSAKTGEGYWMKHIGDTTYNTGDEWPAIQIVPHEPINVPAGWSLIGGYEDTVATATLTTNPPGLIEGSVYEYSGGYQVATNLVPGYGYWIKLSGAGQINIPEVLTKAR